MAAFASEVELSETYDYLLKFVIIGESGTGKTCLLHRFLTGNYKSPSLHTVGVEFNSTHIRLPSTISDTPTASRSPRYFLGPGASGNQEPSTPIRTLKLQLWDTAGQERFQSVSRSYYRNACGAIVCYDISRRSSFTNLTSWIADARALASPNLIIVLVGLKLDADERREVDYIEASRWAKENDLLFVETSALTGENINQPFYLLTRAILVAIESGKIDPDSVGSGISYGERTLRRSSSYASGFKLRAPGWLNRGGCC